MNDSTIAATKGSPMKSSVAIIRPMSKDFSCYFIYKLANKRLSIAAGMQYLTTFSMLSNRPHRVPAQSTLGKISIAGICKKITAKSITFWPQSAVCMSRTVMLAMARGRRLLVRTGANALFGVLGNR
jgi:hypothetical protein